MSDIHTNAMFVGLACPLQLFFVAETEYVIVSQYIQLIVLSRIACLECVAGVTCMQLDVNAKVADLYRIVEDFLTLISKLKSDVLSSP